MPHTTGRGGYKSTPKHPKPKKKPKKKAKRG